MSQNRNIVNHDEINSHLERLKTFYSDPLYHEFIDKNVKNFILKKCIVKDAEKDFIASFPGPYHKVTFEEMPSIEKVCENVIVRILRKQLNSSLEITQVQLATLINSDLEYIGNTNSYYIYKILNDNALNKVGNDLHNCLRGRKIKDGESFFVLRTKSGNKNFIALYMNDGYIVEARTDYDFLPSAEDWEEIREGFKDFNFGRLMPSSVVVAKTIMFFSVVVVLSSLFPDYVSRDLVKWILFFSMVFTTFYCMLANLHSRDLVLLLRKNKIERFFYEKL